MVQISNIKDELGRVGIKNRVQVLKIRLLGDVRGG